MKTYKVPQSIYAEALRLINEVSDQAAYERMAAYSDEMAIMCGEFSNCQIEGEKIIFHDCGNDVGGVLYDGTFAIIPKN